MNAVMIDIEGMGKTPCSPITSIGAVKFDPAGDTLGETFQLHVSLENCLRLGMRPDAETIVWWLEQSDAARLGLTCGQIDAAPLVTAMEALAAFIGDAPGPNGPEVWCKGGSHDFAILRNACAIVGMPEPWYHRCECDMRLLQRLYPNVDREFDGTRHNALDDAKHQARLVQRLMQEHDRRAAA